MSSHACSSKAKSTSTASYKSRVRSSTCHRQASCPTWRTESRQLKSSRTATNASSTSLLMALMGPLRQNTPRLVTITRPEWPHLTVVPSNRSPTDSIPTLRESTRLKIRKLLQRLRKSHKKNRMPLTRSLTRLTQDLRAVEAGPTRTTMQTQGQDHLAIKETASLPGLVKSSSVREICNCLKRLPLVWSTNSKNKELMNKSKKVLKMAVSIRFSNGEATQRIAFQRISKAVPWGKS